MKRIAFAALLITFVTVGAFPESKAKSTTAPKQLSVSQPGLTVVQPSVPLSALFPAPSDETTVSDARGMVSMAAPNHEVVMARINTDGTRSHACVETETAARAFLANQKSGAAPAGQGK